MHEKDDVDADVDVMRCHVTDEDVLDVCLVICTLTLHCPICASGLNVLTSQCENKI
jgi:hypothetical protein